VFKIKPDVNVDPPPGFDTESMFLLRTIPFSLSAFDGQEESRARLPAE
jgi:hypothetical protein